MFKSCFILLSAIAYWNAAVALFPHERKPAEFANEEGCYLSRLNKVLPYGEPYYPDNNKTCEQYKCSKETKMTTLVTCGSVAVPPGCRTVSDLSKNYPDCCPQFLCDGKRLDKQQKDRNKTQIISEYSYKE